METIPHSHIHVNIDSATEVSVNGIIRYDLLDATVGDQVVFSFDMKGSPENPWHFMVVTKERLTHIEMVK